MSATVKGYRGRLLIANKVDWMGLTRKWGIRWVAQVRTNTEVLFDCPHGHPTRRDALACPEALAELYRDV